MSAINIKVVFMGTPEFAVGSLHALIMAGVNIAAVVTVPDKPAGRGQKIQESDVKQYAQKQNIPILQPEKLKDPLFTEQLKEINADLYVVVAFRMLPEIVWSMPRLGTINLHGSLLPHYRGAAPINHAVINGETETGVTTFFIEKEIDTGKIIFSDKISIQPNDSAGLIHDRLMETGAKLIVKTVDAIKRGEYPQTSQLEHLKPGETVKLAPKIFKEDCKINWELPVIQIHNLIRGLSPYPTAWSVFIHKTTGDSLTFKIFQSEIEIKPHAYKVKEIISDEKLYVKIAVDGGFILIKSIQLEGKKRLRVDEFLRGFKINDYKLM